MRYQEISFYLKKLAKSVQDRMEIYKHHGQGRLSEKDLKNIHRKLLGKYGPYKIYIINGEYIRDKIDIDFILGGNPGRYGYIPEDEIWIGDTTEIGDMAPNLLHEYIELRKMIDIGWDYDKAHDYASSFEIEFRKIYKPSGDIVKDFIRQIEKIKNKLNLK